MTGDNNHRYGDDRQSCIHWVNHGHQEGPGGAEVCAASEEAIES